MPAAIVAGGIAIVVLTAARMPRMPRLPRLPGSAGAGC
jgi:hypothetical protein